MIGNARFKSMIFCVVVGYESCIEQLVMTSYILHTSIVFDNSDILEL